MRDAAVPLVLSKDISMFLSIIAVDITSNIGVKVL